jgi:glutamate-ammonia-ligase adenylyltransferase
LARETRQRRDYKTGRGGALDIECGVQYLQLRHGNQYPELSQTERLESQIENLARLGIIEAEVAGALLRGWDFLQRLGSRLRVVENRSISSLDVERADLDSLARQLGYPEAAREGGARRALLKDYDEVTEQIRGIYVELLREDAAGSIDAVGSGDAVGSIDAVGSGDPVGDKDVV